MMGANRIVTLEIASAMEALAEGGMKRARIADIYGCAKLTVTRAIRRFKAGYQFENHPVAERAPYVAPDPNDHVAHAAAVLDMRPAGFPVAFSRPHSRRAA